MQIRLDPHVNTLSIAFGDGAVERTVEISEGVYADLDGAGDPLGVEFLNADDFIPFLRDRASDAAIPPRLRDLLGAITSG